MPSINRRFFIASGLAAAAAQALPRATAATSSNDVRVAVVGLGIRGASLIDQFRSVPGARVAGICDPDAERLSKQQEKLAAGGSKVKAHQDVRHLLDDPDIDAVVIATPNHWHALMGVWASEAGKHVYVEKPVSHNLFEGWQLLAAARKHRRVVQTGTQIRSNPGLRKAVEIVHSGKLGAIQLVRGLCYNRRDSIGKVTTPQQVPESVDYDLWSGPAELKPVMRKQFHYDWHWDFTYGNGDLVNQGAHELDVCRWFVGANHLPRRVMTAGGRLGYDDNGNTPNTLVTLLEYETAPLLLEVRGLPTKKGEKRMDNVRGKSVGVVVECEQGYFAGDWGGGSVHDASGAVIHSYRCDSVAVTHLTNFIEAVRADDSEKLHADIEQGVLSAALGHLSNASYRTGEPTPAEEIKDRVKSDSAIQEALGRMADHLARNDVDLEKSPLVLGPMLAWDQGARQFSNSPAANRLLSREYRKGYVVPDLAGQSAIRLRADSEASIA